MYRDKIKFVNRWRVTGTLRTESDFHLGDGGWAKLKERKSVGIDGVDADPDYATIEAGSAELFNYPYVHMTGHGNVVFSDAEAENLRTYLIGGGFLHIDDNYGIDPFVRPAMKKVFPELQFIELPFTHPIYHQMFEFKNGLPKIHKHDGTPPQGFGLFWEGRLVCFYSYGCDLGDGWEDQSVHNDPEEKRQQALKMGANLVQFVFQQ